jgi:hypothetical protein
MIEDELEVVITDTVGGNGMTWMQPIAFFDREQIDQIAYFDFVHTAKKLNAYRSSSLSTEKGTNEQWVHIVVSSLGVSEYTNADRRMPYPAVNPRNFALARWE